MRPYLILLLLVPPSLPAAEPLNSAALAGAYISGSGCAADAAPDGCPKAAQVVAERALHEAEHPGAPLRAADPDALPPPASLPPPVVPSAQEITRGIEAVGQALSGLH